VRVQRLHLAPVEVGQHGLAAGGAVGGHPGAGAQLVRTAQRLEPGAALAQELGRLGPAGPSWPTGDVQAALCGYEYRRLVQASRVQRTARTWGEIWHVHGVAMALRDEAFRLRAEDDFSRIDWLYQDSAA
jgi:3-hydroxybenzoate 6-monooxygenase